MVDRIVKVGVSGLCLVLAASPLAAFAQAAPPVAPLQQSAAEPAAANSAAAEYVLGPDDVIEVEIVGQPDKARARVYTDGTIQLNLVGKMTASGKTPRELGAEIAQTLKAGGFYANPAINVEVINYASRYVTVLGAVTSPGLVPINRTYRLSEIIARVGDGKGTAADYVVVTLPDGSEHRYLREELARGGDAKDPIVPPGAKIFVPEAEIFYVSGQVNAPGPFAMRTGMTVRQAIARAGGLTASGTDKKVEVNRGGKKVKLAGEALVEPGDVLVVGERLF